MGKGIDLETLWQAFDGGKPYIRKVSHTELYLLRFTFENDQNLPLFDHEVIYKTIKGTFHDIKKGCFKENQYNNFVPIFLYKVDRGSGIYEFLAQLDPILVFLSVIGTLWAADRALTNRDQKALEFIRSNFPNASLSDVTAYVMSKTFIGKRKVLKRLINQGLKKIELSKSSHSPAMDLERVDMEPVVNLKQIKEDS